MKLSSMVRNANPVRTPTELSVTGRAELRRIVGTQPSGPVIQSRSQSQRDSASDRTTGPGRIPGRPRRTLWLAPSLAAIILVTGVCGFLTLSDRSPLTSYAFADTITATVMPAEVTPIPLATSIVFEIPYPTMPSQAQTYVVKRTWLSVDEVYWAGWTEIPSDLTFTLQTVTDDIGYYRAENWPYDKVFQMLIVGPGSSRCQGGDIPYADASFEQIMADTWFFLCDFVLAQASPDTYSPPAMDALTMIQGGWSAPDGLGTTAVEIYGNTQNPDLLISILEQFDLGMNGRWISLPQGYKSWDQVFVPMGSCGGSLAFPFPYAGQDFDPGSYCAFAPDGVSAVTFDVHDDGTCVFKSGEDMISTVGITLNTDGTCTYNP